MELNPLYNYIILDEYYQPELFESLQERNYERYRINGDRDKELSLNEYLNTVRTNVNDLITKNKMLEKSSISYIYNIIKLYY